ncbi:helix-turn-helix domain-containing protein [Streptomyces anulatus]
MLMGRATVPSSPTVTSDGLRIITPVFHAWGLRLPESPRRVSSRRHSRLPVSSYTVRLLAVSALMEGRDQVEVAALFKVSARAVDNWSSKWQAGGRDSLLSRSRGRHVGGAPGPVRGRASGRSCSITPPATWGFPVSCGHAGR